MIFAVAVAAAVRSGNEPNPAEPPAPAGPEAFNGLFLPHQLAGGFSAVIQRVMLSILTDVSGTPTSLNTSCAHERLLNGPGGAEVGVVEPLPAALPFEPVAPLCVWFPCVEVPPDELLLLVELSDELWLLLSDEFELSDESELSLDESELSVGPELSPEESELSVGPELSLDESELPDESELSPEESELSVEPELSPEESELSVGPELSPDESELSVVPELSPEESELSVGPELSPEESELSVGPELSPDESELSVVPKLSVDGSAAGASAVYVISVPSLGSPVGSAFGLR